MFFLNLTAGEFFGLLGVLGGAVTALYFLDRSKRRKVVSTLQFWVSAATASQQRSRKKVNQPWSLLLQLLSLVLLLLAIAQLQWGTRGAAGRDHVLLLDTSSWSDAKVRNRTVLRAEIESATRYLAALPTQDRVLLVRADALTTPVTAFTTDREQTQTALQATTSSFSALDLSRALSYAAEAQRWSGGAPGEVVYIGPQRVNQNATAIVVPPNLRLLPVTIDGPNYGIRRIEVKRSGADPNAWQALITLMNYGDLAQPLKLRTQFAGTRFATRAYSISPHQEMTAEYNFVTNTEGQFTSQIEGSDILADDDSASLRLPGNRSFAVALYTKRADLFRPLVNADRRISATFFDPTQASRNISADLVILDGFSPTAAMGVGSIWIDPPRQRSPLPVKALVNNAAITKWNSRALAAAGLHAREDRIPQAEIFETQPGDVVLADIAGDETEGPTVVLRPESGNQKGFAAIGFDLLDSHLRFTLTPPLLFASLLNLMAPEAVRTTELRTGRVGSVSVALEPDENAHSLRVTTDNGIAIPFTVHEQTLQLFADKPSIIHIVSEARDRVLSLSLPDVAETTWKPAGSSVATGIPSFSGLGESSVDLWQWLAGLGALGLLIEWLLFGRSRGVLRLRKKGAAVEEDKKHEEEFAAR